MFMACIIFCYLFFKHFCWLRHQPTFCYCSFAPVSTWSVACSETWKCHSLGAVFEYSRSINCVLQPKRDDLRMLEPHTHQTHLNEAATTCHGCWKFWLFEMKDNAHTHRDISSTKFRREVEKSCNACHFSHTPLTHSCTYAMFWHLNLHGSVCMCWYECRSIGIGYEYGYSYFHEATVFLIFDKSTMVVSVSTVSMISSVSAHGKSLKNKCELENKCAVFGWPLETNRLLF